MHPLDVGELPGSVSLYLLLRMDYKMYRSELSVPRGSLTPGVAFYLMNQYHPDPQDGDNQPTLDFAICSDRKLPQTRF